MKALINGQWLASENAAMTELPSDAAGVFETLLVRDGSPVFCREHWRRFDAGCRWFDLKLPVNERQLYELADRCVAENGVRNGVMRYAAWRLPHDATHWQIEAGPPRPHMAGVEFSVTVGPILPPPDNARTFKHLGRKAWLQTLREARARGFDEVLLRDDAGRVLEGGVSNVFFVRSGRLCTPPVGAGILPGVMRSAVLDIARSLHWTVSECLATSRELETSDEVWLTNSLIGVKPVRSLDAREFPPHRPVLEALRPAWKAKHGWDPAQPCA